MVALPDPRGAGRRPEAQRVVAPGLARLHARVLGCTRCVEAGLLSRAEPVLPQPWAASVVLVGQAPGRVELVARQPFSGRAGRQLFRWLVRAGCTSEGDARRRVYCTSITKCYPGPALGGTGDRRPSGTEVRLCRPFLDRQLQLLQPRVIIAVGGLAQSRFLPPGPLAERVGRCFDAAGVEIATTPRTLRAAACGGRGDHPRPWVLPLPHPSGASRWLNRCEHALLLDGALLLLAALLHRERPGRGDGVGIPP